MTKEELIETIQRLLKTDIDQFDELLSTSDTENINAIIAKLEKLKKKDAEARAQPEEEVEEIVQTTGEADDITEVVVEAYEGLETVEYAEEVDLIELITVAKRTSSGKYFIYLEGDSYSTDMVINPVGRILPFEAGAYEDLEDIELDELLANEIINDEQLNELKKYKRLERYRHDVQQQERPPERMTYGGGRFSYNFTINQSFLENGYLTVPREFNDCLMGTTEQHDRCDIWLTSINGSSLGAYLYHGESGWGRYFQIRMTDRAGFIYDGGLENKQIGDTIQVLFEGDINRPKFKFE